MRKIMLFCATGMSTNLLVSKLEKEVITRNLEGIEIIAVGQNEFEKQLKDVDVCLLGPQVRYLLKKAKELGLKHNVPIDAINPVDYGTVNAKKVLDLALKLMEESPK